MDVKGLYPSVPKKEGLDACKQALDNRPNPSIPTTDVLSMIRLVLENNIFHSMENIIYRWKEQQ